MTEEGEDKGKAEKKIIRLNEHKGNGQDAKGGNIKSKG